MASETTMLRATVAGKERLTEIGKKEGLAMAETIDHVLAFYDAPREPAAAPAKGKSAPARGAKKASVSSGDRSDQMRAQREAAWEENERRKREYVKSPEATHRAALALMGDCCRICGTPKDSRHTAKCRRSLMGTVYEGRDYGASAPSPEEQP